MATTSRTAGAFDRRLKVTIALLAAGLWLAVTGLRGYDLWDRREQTLQTGERRAANVALIVSTHLRATFAAADATLRQLTLFSRQVGGPTASAPQWRPMLELSRTQRNGLGSVTVIDADGMIQHSTVPEIIGSSRKETFLYRRLQGNERDMMHADTPFRSVINPALMLLPLGRRLTNASGEFDGGVVATFTPAHVLNFYHQLDIGRSGQISVYHPEGYIVVRVPSETGATGEKVQNDPLFEEARKSSRPRTWRIPASANMPARVVALQFTGEPRLFVGVALNAREVLVDWRRDVEISALVLGTLGLGLMLVVGFVFRQIDARGAAEAALVRAQRLDALGQLTGGVAHDFNNFLTVIMMNVSVLKLPGGAGEPGSPDAAQIEQIENAARRAAALTQQLLAFARRQPLKPTLIDLNELVREVQPLLTRVLGEDITIKLVLAPTPCPAQADRVQLESALINLSINARDAMPNGGLLLIETEFAAVDKGYGDTHGDLAPGPYVRLSVSDTGTGIEPEHLPRLFEPFFTTKPVGKGTGLGLSMVYGFMKQSGGHVKIYSERGRGTAVRLYFPLAKGTPKPRSAAPNALKPARPGEVILLLEDEPVVRQVAEMMLGKLGYRVVSATNGAEALARAHELERIDLFLTDVVLPGGMNGRQAAEQLTRDRPGVPVVYASGYSQDILNDRGQFAPELRVIPKPYDIQTLADAVRAAIDGEDVSGTPPPPPSRFA